MYKYALAVTIIASGFLAPSAANAFTRGLCTFHENADYKGKSAKVYDGQEMSSLGEIDNRISSLKCTKGCKATLFTGKDLTGSTATMGTVRKMSDGLSLRMENKTSSIRVKCS